MSATKCEENDMIDISQEELIPLGRAVMHVPRRRRGRKAAVSTLHRWATLGVRGVILETLQVGGTRCTSIGALQRFFNSLTPSIGQTKQPNVEMPSRLREEQVEQELNSRLVTRRPADYLREGR
jgi:Protein of unknown function (DUF1580)